MFSFLKSHQCINHNCFVISKAIKSNNDTVDEQLDDYKLGGNETAMPSSRQQTFTLACTGGGD